MGGGGLTLVYGDSAALTIAVDQRVLIPALFIRADAAAAYHLTHRFSNIEAVQGVTNREEIYAHTHSLPLGRVAVTVNTMAANNCAATPVARTTTLFESGERYSH